MITVMPRAFSDDLRMRSVLLYALNHSKEEIAGRLGMSSKSVLRFARRYNEVGTVHADKQGRPAGSYALSQQDQAVLLQEMLEHPERTLGELCEHIRRVCGTRVAVSTLHDYFSRNGITRKMVSVVRRFIV